MSTQLEVKNCFESSSARILSPQTYELCRIPLGATFVPQDYMDLIECLGHTCITQDQAMLFQFARQLQEQVADWVALCTSLSDSSEGVAVPSPLQRYIELVLSTRHKLEDNPEMDQRLMIAASNAISILSYAYQCGMTEFQFSDVGDFSYCRIPYANFNTSSLSGCNFDYADLSEASFYKAFLRGASFRSANLRNATTYSIEAPSEDGPWRYVQIAPHGEWFVTIPYRTKCLQFWDGATVELIRQVRLPDEDGRRYAIAISSDSLYVAISNSTPLVYIWDVQTGTLTHTLGPHPHPVECVAFHPEGGYVATGTLCDTVHLWDTTCSDYSMCKWSVECKERETSCFVQRVERIAFSADGNLLAELVSGQIRIRATDTAEEVLVLQGLTSYTIAKNLAFSPDARYLAIYIDRSVEIRDLQSNPDEPIFKQSIFDIAQLLHLTRDENILVSRFESIGINFWRFVSDVQGHKQFFADGQRAIVAANAVQHIAAAAWTANRNIHSTRCTRPLVLGSRGGAPLSFSPDGAFFLVLGEVRRSFNLYTSLSLIDSETLSCLDHKICPTTIQRATWSIDGSTVFLSGDRIVFVLDLRSHEIVRIIGETEEVGRALEVFSARSSNHLRMMQEGQLQITNVNLHLLPCATPSRRDNQVIVVVLAREGHPAGIGLLRLDSGNDDSVKTYPLPDADTTNHIPSTARLQPGALSFSSDDKYLAFLRRNGALYVWDTVTGELILHSVPEYQICICDRPEQQLLAFSPDDRFIASLGYQLEVCVWDLSSRSLKMKLSGSPRPLGTVAWSPHGHLIAAGGRDLIRFWSIETGECVHCSREIGIVKALGWNSKTNALITVDAVDAVIQRWNVQLLRRKVPRIGGRNWRVRPKFDRMRWFAVDSGFLEGDFADAALSPSFVRSIQKSVNAYYLKAAQAPIHSPEAFFRGTSDSLEASTDEDDEEYEEA